MKKNILFALSIVCLWVLVFLAMIIPNERQVSVPEEYPRIILETQPRDPRDLLRGDYVILQYDFARRGWNDDSFNNNFLKNAIPGETVYVIFSVAQDGRATPVETVREKPKNGTFLRGKVYGKNSWNREIRFGIERFFVPAGKGRELEKAQRNNNLEAVVAVHPENGKGLVVELLVGKTKVDFNDIEADIRGW